MGRKKKIGNGFATPLTFETMEAAEEGTLRLRLAIEQGKVNDELLYSSKKEDMKAWFRQTGKYYIVPVSEREILEGTDEGTCKLREAVLSGEVDIGLIETNLQEWFRQTRKYYL